MSKRIVFLIFALVYSALFFTYFAIKEKFTPNCNTYRSVCVRLCCFDEKTCENEFIQTHFNNTEVHSFDGAVQPLKIVSGRPPCYFVTKVEPGIEKLVPSGYIRNAGDIDDNDFFFDSNSYCLEGKEISEDDTVVWDVWSCDNPKKMHIKAHNYLMGIASVFIAVGLIACVMSKSLNSVAGRCKLMLLLSLLLLYFVYTVIMNQFDVVQPHLDDITLVLIFAYLMMCLWMTVMAFDIWWTFRYQIKTQDVSRKFRTYCFYVFGCIVFLYLAAITADMLNIGLFFYLKWQLSGFVVLVLSVADIVLLIHTGIMVSKFVKESETSRNAWFEAEKERFWSYLGVFCVLLITRIFELYTFKTRSFRQKFVVNSITAFSAIVIVFILAFKKILISSKKCFV